MRSKVKFHKGELAKKVLLGFGAVAGIALVMVVPPAGIGIKALIDLIFKIKESRPSRTQVMRTVRRLEGKKLISLREENGELVATFTANGQKAFNRYKFDDLKIPVPKRWDGKWRLVGFDIPEKKKLARDVLREKLRSLGFCQLQKSLFVHPYECGKEIELIKRVYEIGPYVRYIIADSLDNESVLRSKFNL